MAGFQKVAETKDIQSGESKLVEVGGRKIALFNVGGEIFAIADTCSHKGGPLSDGELDGEEVTCPWHGATFNVKTGEGTGGPHGGGVQRYNVQVEGNDIKVEVP